MTITPTQAKHIMAHWVPVRHHAEFSESVGNIEKCVTPQELGRAGIRPSDLDDEAGGLYVGPDYHAGSERVHTFDVRQTERRAAMTVAEFEEFRKSVVEVIR